MNIIKKNKCIDKFKDQDTKTKTQRQRPRPRHQDQDTPIHPLLVLCITFFYMDLNLPQDSPRQTKTRPRHPKTPLISTLYYFFYLVSWCLGRLGVNFKFLYKKK